MAAPKENQFWKLRSHHGRDKLFSTPLQLWQAGEQYFSSIDETEWAVNGQMRKLPYTIGGFILFIGASENYWGEFRKRIGDDLKKDQPDPLSKDFMGVIERIELVIRTQKLTGAMIGAFKENIISAELHLAQRIETRQVDKNGNDVQGTAQIIVVQRPLRSDEEGEPEIQEEE